MLKGRSLKSFVALVVFCFSLLLSCISPCFAAVSVSDAKPSQSYDDAHGITLYGCNPTLDPIRNGIPFSLPIFDYAGVASLSDGYSYPYYYRLKSLQFQPFSYDVTLVLGLTVIATSSARISATFRPGYLDFGYGTTDYFLNSRFKLEENFVNGTEELITDSPLSSAPYAVVYYVLPAGCNGFEFDTGGQAIWTPFSVSGGDGVLCCVCGYVVYSTDVSIIEQVRKIVSQSYTSNVKLTQILAVCNDILSQCRDIKANSDSIVTLLTAVQKYLVSVDGTVTDIYTLLKDALASETAELDKESEKVGDQLLQRVDNEQYWEDKNTDTFNAIGLDGFSFDDGITGALATVGNLFSSIWNAMGSSVIIYTFPLMLGLALVIIGRISRNSGKSGKKGGGDS